MYRIMELRPWRVLARCSNQASITTRSPTFKKSCTFNSRLSQLCVVTPAVVRSTSICATWVLLMEHRLHDLAVGLVALDRIEAGGEVEAGAWPCVEDAGRVVLQRIEVCATVTGHDHRLVAPIAGIAQTVHDPIDQ